MKRKTIAVLILFLIAAIILATIVISSYSPQSTKAILPEEFVQTMEEKGFIIVDATEQLNVERAVAALNGTYQVDYLYFLSDELAEDFFYAHKDKVIESVHTSYTSATLNLGNFLKYTQQSDVFYSMLIQAENCIVFVEADVNLKDEIDVLIKSLGYGY